MPCPHRGSLKLFIAVLLLLPFSLSILGAQTSGTKKVDPCALLTKAEIQEALGKPVQDGKPNTNANPAVGLPCQYVVGDYGSFSILIKTARPGETPDALQAGLNQKPAKPMIKIKAAP